MTAKIFTIYLVVTLYATALSNPVDKPDSIPSVLNQPVESQAVSENASTSIPTKVQKRIDILTGGETPTQDDLTSDSIPQPEEKSDLDTANTFWGGYGGYGGWGGGYYRRPYYGYGGGWRRGYGGYGGWGRGFGGYGGWGWRNNYWG